MDTFVKVSAIAIIAVILNLMLSYYRKDISVLLSITVCCVIGALALSYFKPVFNFFQELVDLGKLDNVLVSSMLKCAGIGLLGDITVTVCNEAGNNSVAKILQLTATALILCISVPLFDRLLSLIQEILIAV